jgi:AbrB family looped-hinge helix DNA binding protein
MSIAMHIGPKGQVTIPIEIRKRLDLSPHTKVEFEIVGDELWIRKARSSQGMTTDEQLRKLTPREGRPIRFRK